MSQKKSRITNDQFVALKRLRSDEFELQDRVQIVQRCLSMNDPDYCICTVQDATIVGFGSSSHDFLVEIYDGSQMLISLNRGLSRWEFSKNYKYETFLIKCNG